MRKLCLFVIMVLQAQRAACDNPKLLAEDFVDLAKTVRKLGSDITTFADYQRAQKNAIPFYKDFLESHPDSVYTNKVRWTLYTAYITLQRREKAEKVLYEIQDSVLQELLRVSYALRNVGEKEKAGQLLEGMLKECEDGGVKARIAQFLCTTRKDPERGLKILNEVIEHSRYRREARARALLIKADLYERKSNQRVSLLKELADKFPETPAGKSGERKLRAAKLSKGSEAIPFEVTTTAGKTLSLSKLRGKRVLLYFWATWSNPSRTHLKELKKIVEESPGEDPVVIGIACENYAERAKGFFFDTHKLPWHLVAEGKKWHNTLALLYDVDSLPFYVLIDKQGRIVTLGTISTERIKKALQG